MKEILLALDSRKRISMGALAGAGSLHQQYLATLHEDGIIVLVPAVVLTLERSQQLKAAENILREQQSRLDDEPPF